MRIGGDRIDFTDEGSGPALLFVPGSFATPSAWRGVLKRLPSAYRIMATSLRGYGGTEESRTLGDHGMDHEVSVVEAAAARAGEPVILVGHSFGGTVALATALQGRVPVRAIATFEANPLAVITGSATPGLYDETRSMSEAFEAAHHAGERDAAARIIDFWTRWDRRGRFGHRLSSPSFSEGSPCG